MTGRAASWWVRCAPFLVITLAACSATHSERLEAFRTAYNAGDYATAEASIDELLAEDSGADLEVVKATNGLDESIDGADGDTHLLLLDKAMVRLAQEDAGTAAEVLHKARTTFDDRYVTSFGDYWNEIAASLSDDTSIDYAGWDFEHLLIRTMEFVCEIMREGRYKNAWAYSEDIVEKQEQIVADEELGDDLDEDTKYSPRDNYRLSPFGMYMSALYQEVQINASVARQRVEAALKYAREGGYDESTVTFLEAELARIESQLFTAPGLALGQGGVLVLHLSGRGPYIVETMDETTEAAKQIAAVGVAIVGGSVGALAQAKVPVPAVEIVDPKPRAVSVTYTTLVSEEVMGDDGNVTYTSVPVERSVETASLMDVNAIVSNQIEANKPLIMARAMVRRVVKAGITAVAETAVRQDIRDDQRDDREKAKKKGDPNYQAEGPDQSAEAIAALLGLLVNWIWTSAEEADTRSWSSMPAEIRIARLNMPVGEQVVQVGDHPPVGVRVRPGDYSFVLAFDPSPEQPMKVMVDASSRVAAPAPVATSP